MGNREDLLAGARKCLLERGYANTTARDIAQAAGVSLAAIGYHFGSKEQLLTEALTDAVGEGIGDALEARIREAGADKPLPQAFSETWRGIEELLSTNREAMVASMENLLRVYRSGESRELMGRMTELGIGDLAQMLRDTHDGLDERQARAVAELYFVLLNGFAVLWFMNPDARLPSSDSLALAVRALAGGA